MTSITEFITVLLKVIAIRKNAKASRADLEAHKLYRFRRMVRRLSRQSPFYKQYIEINKLDPKKCVVANFPIMTKTDTQLNFDCLVTDRKLKLVDVKRFVEHIDDPQSLYLGKYQVVCTSGSSGSPVCFVYSRRDWLRGMVQPFRFLPINAMFQSRRYAYYGSVDGRSGALTAVKSGFRQFAANNLVKTFDSASPIEKIVDQLNEFAPRVLGSYTTALLRLAHEKIAGRLLIKPQWIESLAEVMSDEDREFIETTFECGLYNIYGCAEHQLMGIAGPGSDGMILYDDDLIYEFGDDHILVTNLNNTVLPLIRYKIMDVIKPRISSSQPPYIQVASWIGREVNSATFKNREGRKHFISSMHLMRKILPGVQRFQMRPQNYFSFIFDLTLAPQADVHRALGAAQLWLQNLLTRRNLTNVDFLIRIVTDFNIDTKTRKFRLIDLSDFRDTLMETPKQEPLTKQVATKNL